VDGSCHLNSMPDDPGEARQPVSTQNPEAGSVMALDGISAGLLREHRVAVRIIVRDRQQNGSSPGVNCGALETARVLWRRRSSVGLLRTSCTARIRKFGVGGEVARRIDQEDRTRPTHECRETCSWQDSDGAVAPHRILCPWRLEGGQLRHHCRGKRFSSECLSVRHEQSGPQSAG
jgi:hypothetical protein